MKNIIKRIVIAAIIFPVCMASCKSEKGPQLGIVVPVGDERVSDELPYVVHEVIENSPAYKAGLQGDDVIVQVGGVPIKGMKHGYVYRNLLLGEPGTVVTLVVLRNNEKKVFQIIRGGRKK